MKNEFVLYEQALALKDLGFDEECFGHYQIFEDRVINFDTISSETNERLCKKEGFIKAPLYQQAFRFFRGEYDLVAEIQAPDGKNGKWNPTIHKVYGFGNHYDNDGFDTYEEAELACLRKLIEIVKNKENENNNK